MKLKSKNSQSKSLSSKTLVVLASISLVLLVSFYLFSKIILDGASVTKNTSDLEQDQNVIDFGKVENDDYVFFYPSKYVKTDSEEAATLEYQNNSTKAVAPESIILHIVANTKKLPNPTYQSCLRVAESMRQKAEDEIKAEVVRGGLGGDKGIGCKIIMKLPIPRVNDAVMIVRKDLWNEDGSDNSIYTAKAVYYVNASKDEAQKLDLAVDQFALK